MQLELDGDRIVLRAPQLMTVKVKEIPGVRFDRDRRVWLLPLSWASCVTARGVLGDELEVGPKLAAWALAEKEGRIAPSMALREAKDFPEDRKAVWDSFFNAIEAGGI